MNRRDFQTDSPNHKLYTFSKNKLLKAVYNKLSENFISYWKRELYSDDNKTNEE